MNSSPNSQPVKTISLYKVKVQRSILLVFLFASLTVIFFVKLISSSMADTHATDFMVNHSYETIKYLENLKSTVAESESITHGYVATGDSQWRKALAASHAKTIQLLQEARSHVKDNIQQKRLLQLELALKEKMKFQQFLVNHDSITAVLKEKVGYYGDERHISVTIQSLFDQFMTRQHQLLQERSEASAQAKNKALATTIIGTALTFIFIVATLWRLNKDIQRRKVAEEEIRVSEQKYRRLIEDAGVTLFTSDLRGVFSYVSNRCFELTGYTAQELSGESFASLVAAEWIEQVAGQYQQQVASRQPESDMEFPIITKDQQRKWVEQHAVLLFDEQNQPFGFQCVVKDINEKKEAQERLRQSEELTRTVLDNTREGFFMVNREYQLMVVNRKAKDDMEALSGRRVEVGMNLFDFTMPEEKEIAKENLRRVWEGEVLDFESSYQFPEGKVWTRISHSPVRDKDGFIFGVAIVTHDITRAKLSEQEALEAGQKIKAMLASTQEGFYMIGPDYTMIMVNEAAQRNLKSITGLNARLGDSILTFLMPERKDNFIQLFNRVMKGNIEEVEARIFTPEGEKWFHNNYFPVRGEGKEVIGVCVSSKDITERKLVENALEKIRMEKEEYQFRLQSILDNTPLIVFIKDLQGRYLLINQSFREVFHRTEQEVIGKTDFDFDSTEEAIRYRQLDEEVINTLQSIEREETVHSDEGDRNLLLMKFPLFDRDNNIYGVGGIATDFTERVHNRQKLIEAKKKAETAEHLQEQFLANMSHEIRTPMNGIIGMTNILMGTELNPEQREFVQIIKQSSDSLLFLINDILDLSKIKSGKFTLEKLPFRLPELLDATLAPFHLRAKEKQIRLLLSLDPSVPVHLLGDPYRLTQILNNLLSNALKFTRKGYIQLTVLPLAQNDLSAELSFSVADTGEGIPEDKVESIFQAFEQGSASTTRKFGGTGLGLAITKKLVEMQGGNIMVSSAENEGTVFRFTVRYPLAPHQQESLPATAADAKAGNQDLAGKRILVVEDNEINQKVMLHILRKEKLEPTLVGNGKVAVELLELGHQYDLIIMDLSMPDMDGFQTATYIRQKLKLDTPIIAMTASALRNEKMKCFQTGMNEYLTKPFAPAELFYHLRRFLLPQADTGKLPEDKQPGDQNELYNLSLIYEMDDSEYFCEVLKLFLDTTPAILEEIKEGVLYENWEQVYKKAHKLKSSLGILQMNSILEMVTQMEQQAKEQAGTELIPEILKKVMEQFNLVKPMIEAELRTALQMNS